MLGAAAVRPRSRFCGRLAYDRCIGARSEIVVLFQAVRAQLQFMHTALDCGLLLAARITKFSRTLPVGTCNCGRHLCPVARLQIHPARRHYHAQRKQHASCNQEGVVRVHSKGGRQKTQSCQSKEASNSHHPTADLQRHDTLFGEPNSRSHGDVQLLVFTIDPAGKILNTPGAYSPA